MEKVKITKIPAIECYEIKIDIPIYGLDDNIIKEFVLSKQGLLELKKQIESNI